MTISTLRTVAWQPPQFGALVPSVLVWPSVLTGATLDYGIDLQLFIADLSPDTVAGAPIVTSTLTGLTITSAAMVGTVASCLIFGGITGATHEVDFTVTMASGKQQVFPVLLPIGVNASRLAATFVGAPGPAGGSSPAAFAAARVIDLASLPTTPPTITGVRWNNNGVETTS